MKRQIRDEELVWQIVRGLEATGRYRELKRYRQHGDVSVYEHCVRVALLSLRIARRHHMDVDMRSMLRGALLHDYFLYDWHAPENRHTGHAVNHPCIALKNAETDYSLNGIERDVILRHMFPITPHPPRTLEGWIVCYADTVSAGRETFNRKRLNSLWKRVLALPERLI